MEKDLVKELRERAIRSLSSRIRDKKALEGDLQGVENDIEEYIKELSSITGFIRATRKLLLQELLVTGTRKKSRQRPTRGVLKKKKKNKKKNLIKIIDSMLKAKPPIPFITTFQVAEEAKEDGDPRPTRYLRTVAGGILTRKGWKKGGMGEYRRP